MNKWKITLKLGKSIVLDLINFYGVPKPHDINYLKLCSKLYKLDWDLHFLPYVPPVLDYLENNNNNNNNTEVIYYDEHQITRIHQTECICPSDFIENGSNGNGYSQVRETRNNVSNGVDGTCERVDSDWELLQTIEVKAKSCDSDDWGQSQSSETNPICDPSHSGSKTQENYSSIKDEDLREIPSSEPPFGTFLTPDSLHTIEWDLTGSNWEELDPIEKRIIESRANQRASEENIRASRKEREIERKRREIERKRRMDWCARRGIKYPRS